MKNELTEFLRKGVNGIVKTEDEERLLKAAAAGDQTAFSEIVSAYERLVYNTVKSKVLSAEDAMDISQEVFLKIWRALPNWRGECRFATWVYKVCINASLDFLRRAPERTEPLNGYPDADGDEHPLEIADDSVCSSPEGKLEQSETTLAVRRAIAKLPDDQRQVVVLRDIEGYSYEEIAEMLSLGIGTVKSRINRARCRLKAVLEAELGLKK